MKGISLIVPSSFLREILQYNNAAPRSNDTGPGNNNAGLGRKNEGIGSKDAGLKKR